MNPGFSGRQSRQHNCCLTRRDRLLRADVDEAHVTRIQLRHLRWFRSNYGSPASLWTGKNGQYYAGWMSLRKGAELTRGFEKAKSARVRPRS